METISLQSCGYYYKFCGYGIVLWIVDIILFQAVNFREGLSAAAAPEKRAGEMRADDAPLVESETDPQNETTATPRPWNWDTFSKSQKSHWRRKHK